MATKKKRWIQDIHMKKGAFTKQAKSAGKSVHEYAEEEAHSKTATPKTKKRAVLALNLAKFRKKK